VSQVPPPVSPGSSGVVEGIAQRVFPIARRGFAPAEVRAYLREIGSELAVLRNKVRALEQELEQARARPPSTALDVAELTTALGEETARVLSVAHEAAAELRARAEEGAARVLREAQEEAARLVSDAERLLSERAAEAEALAARMRVEAEERAARTREAAQAEAEAALAAALERAKEMVAEAQSARERMLADLARRRKVALTQLEQLRAGRDRLLEAYGVVRESLEATTAELERSDDQARRAAEAAGRRAAPEDLRGEALVAEALGAEPVVPGAPKAPPVEAGAPPVSPAVSAEPAAPAEPASATAVAPAPVHDPPPVMVLATTHVETPPAPVSPETQPFPETQLGESLVHQAEVGDVAVQRPAVGALFAQIRAEAEAAAERTAPLAAVCSDGEGGRGLDDRALLQRRDEIVGPLHAKLVRRLRGALMDDQNLLLDRLRTSAAASCGADAVSALVDPEEHSRLLRDLARPALVDAEQAGGTLASTLTPGVTGEEHPDEGFLAEITQDLAEAVVAPLRERLRSVIAGSGGEDVTDRVSAAYREARQRLPDLAADGLTAALAAGVARAVGPGRAVRWVADDGDGSCADCDDNSLAGDVALGEAFPTGVVRPPAHPGCRCLLVPARA